MAKPKGTPKKNPGPVAGYGTAMFLDGKRIDTTGKPVGRKSITVTFVPLRKP